MQIVIDVPEEEYQNYLKMRPAYPEDVFCYIKAIQNGTPLSTIVDSLKELSKDHRHNYISNSHEERAWRLGIEDSIDLLLIESEEKI